MITDQQQQSGGREERGRDRESCVRAQARASRLGTLRSTW